MFGPSAKIRFRPVDGASSYRFRFRPANTAAVKDSPFEDKASVEADTDGYVRYPVADFATFPKDIEGSLDVHITARDEAGNESPFLEIDAVPFDLVAPEAPEDGAVEA